MTDGAQIAVHSYVDEEHVSFVMDTETTPKAYVLKLLRWHCGLLIDEKNYQSLCTRLATAFRLKRAPELGTSPVCKSLFQAAREYSEAQGPLDAERSQSDPEDDFYIESARILLQEGISGS